MPSKKHVDKQPTVMIYRYSTIVSYVMERFLDDFDEWIYRDDTGVYVFSKGYKSHYLMSVFMEYVHEFFKNEELHPYGSAHTVVVGTCLSHQNWLAEFKHDIPDGDHRKKILTTKILVRYAFSDRNFICDEGYLTSIFDVIFGKAMGEEDIILTPNYMPVKWIGLKNIDESSLARIIKSCHDGSKIFPKRRTNLLFDMNDIVFANIRKNHRVPMLVKEASYVIWDMIRKGQSITGNIDEN